MRDIGRPRKKLIDKSTSIIIHLENSTWFNFLREHNIEFDENAEIFNDDIKEQINSKIVKYIKICRK